MNGYAIRAGGSVEAGSLGVRGRDARLKASMDARSRRLAREGEDADVRAGSEEVQWVSAAAAGKQTSSLETQTDIPRSEEQGTLLPEATAAVVLAVVATRVALDAADRLPRPIRKRVIRTILGTAALTVLAACAPQSGVVPVSPAGENTPTISAAMSATATEEEVKATPMPSPAVESTPVQTVQAAEKPTRVPTLAPVFGGGPETEIQQKLVADQEKLFREGMWPYWAGTADRIVHPGTVADIQAHVKPDPNNPNSMGVAWSAPGESLLYSFPIDTNTGRQIMIPPDHYENGMVVSGNAPLRLPEEGVTEDGIHFNLGWRTGADGIGYWVKVDDAGHILEQAKKGVWEREDPNVEIISQMAGNKKEDYIQWNSTFGAYRVDFIWPGPEYVRSEKTDLLDGNGNKVGESELMTEGWFVIGGELRKLNVPIYWRDMADPDICHYFGITFRCNLLTPEDLTAATTVQSRGGSLQWTPGQKVTIYVDVPEKNGKQGEFDMSASTFTHKFLQGKEDLFEDFVNNGSDEIGIIIGGETTHNCTTSRYPNLSDYCYTSPLVVPLK